MMIETLEGRRHLSATPVAFQDAAGIVYVRGTDAADEISATEASTSSYNIDPNTGQQIFTPPGTVDISVEHTDGSAFGDGTSSLNLEFKNVKAVIIDAGAGDDNVNTYDYSVPMIAFGGDGNDQMFTTDDTSEVSPTLHAGSSLLFGNAGQDNITVWSGNNTIVDAGGDNDTISVFAGSATVLAGSGDDDIAILNSNFTGQPDGPITVAVVDGGNGNDLLATSIGTQVTFYGGNGNDTVAYFGGAVTFYGQNGNDTTDIYQTFPDFDPNESVTMNGGNGNDTLNTDPSQTPIVTSTSSVENITNTTVPLPTL